MNLLTRMKSPTSSVGRIDDDGILNGSTTKERSRNTTSEHREERLRVLDPDRLARRPGRASPRGRRRSASHARPVTDGQDEQDEGEVHWIGGSCRESVVIGTGVGANRVDSDGWPRNGCRSRGVIVARSPAAPLPGTRAARSRIAAERRGRGVTCLPPAARPGTPPAESRRCRRISSASCPPSASRAASSCG